MLTRFSKAGLGSVGLIAGLAVLAGVSAAAGTGFSLGSIQQLITRPVPIPPVSLSSGCDQSATSTGCNSVIKQKRAGPEILSAKSYTEITPTAQDGKVDEHLTVDNALRDVTFCDDKTFKTRQILINGVDVVQRIAELASSDQMGRSSDTKIGGGVCQSMPSNVSYTRGVLEIPDVVAFDAEPSGIFYRVYLSALGFAINAESNEMFLISAYDGSTLTSIGKLK